MGRTASAKRSDDSGCRQLSLMPEMQMGMYSEAMSDETADQQGMLLSKARQYVSVSNNLNMTQRKLVNVLLHAAYSTLLTQEEHCIPISSVEAILEIGSNNRSFLKSTFKKIISTTLEWAIIDQNGKEEWEAAAALAQARVKGNYLYYSYAPIVREKLYNPTQLAVLNLLISNRFRSIYALALYEYCLLYRGQPHTEWVDVATMQKLIGRKRKASGASEKLQEFKIFNRDVIQVAVSEINQISNIIVEPEFQKVGNKVAHIRFRLREKESVQAVAKDAVSVELVAYIVGFGFTEIQARAMAGKYTEPHIRDALAVVENQVSSRKLPPSGVTPFAAKAIREGWANKVNKFQIEEELNERRASALKKELADAEAFNARMRREFTEYRSRRVQELTQNLTDSEREVLRQEFLGTLNQFETSLFKKNGLKSVLVENKFNVFLCSKFLTRPEETNYDEFVRARESR